MKVLHLISSGDFGGAKLHVLSLVKELSKYMDVKLISFTSGLFAEEARQMGINLETVNMGNIVSDIVRVNSIVKTEHYDILHSHGTKANMTAAIVRKTAGIPAVTTVHSDYRLDYMENKFKLYTFGLLNAIALRFMDYYVGVSDSFKEMLVSRGFNRSRIFTVYNGMDFSTSIPPFSKKDLLSKYDAVLRANNDRPAENSHDLSGSRSGLTGDDLMVGILARLHPVKDIGTFIRAAQKVLEKHPDVKFIVGGDGDEKQALQNLAVSLGIRDSVIFLGYIDDPDEFMSAIDINVLTSISESFPYVILEGARIKKPVVSTDVGGISDLVKSGINGFLFKPGDYEQLADYIIRLVNDENLRKRLGHEIYNSAGQTFSLENMCRIQLEIYETIIKAHNK